MPTLSAILLTLALIVVGADDYRTHKQNKANDEAATECAIRTGFVYNCADGSQSASCKGGN